ncbi:HNH endonuclease [Neomicrococcus lactis]|uniref:5-methylcytosine-specific restriction protein A n=1 Tax=Neomicrococcus lactis TaxID=732241 RepID=A0A7W8YD62_9MICC|nr:5-methylcytosine-specific restriction protein A [Neomicrococcus lactis]
MRETTPGVRELSTLLQSASFHPMERRTGSFRSPGSVGMKVNNLIANHPSYLGVGLRVTKAEQDIVQEFIAYPELMSTLASSIQDQILGVVSDGFDLHLDDELVAAGIEGDAKSILTVKRERDPRLRRAKIDSVVLAGLPIDCEVCGFDYGKSYGARGQGYIEVHHRSPLHITGVVETTLDDLALLCANCHRMVHRVSPWLSVEKLKETIVR